MKKILHIFSLLIAIFSNAQESRDIEYIRKYAFLAVQEMELYKIPASITLAQGILETGGGQSRLANLANNHFGIKCKGVNEWPLERPRIYHDDDARGECFRKYNSIEESYRDHSKFLAERPYYKSLFFLDPKDYKAWANGLKRAGYATDSKYPSKLINEIEKYNLDEFDKIGLDEVYAKLYKLYKKQEDLLLAQNIKNKNGNFLVTNDQEINQLAPIKEINEGNKKTIIYETRSQNSFSRIKKHLNNIPYIIAEPGESIFTISQKYKISSSSLAKYNEIEPTSKLNNGQIVFLAKKKNKGSVYSYVVQPGDDMYSISQKFGIKIKKLYKYNRLNYGDKPTIGQRINLKTKIRS